jgi:Ankyrin repeats (3 copies)
MNNRYTSWRERAAATPHESGLDCTSELYGEVAGMHADIATLAAAHTLGMPYTEMTIISAAQCNKFAELRYLHGQGCPWCPHVLTAAASSGSFELLRWCYERSCRCFGGRVALCAAESGDVELMAWFLQQPEAQLSAAALQGAAREGHAAMVQFLCEQQCPRDSSATASAASGGHVDVLRWLVDNGCPWVAGDLGRSAADAGSVAVLAYLQQQGMLATDAAALTMLLDIAGMHSRLTAAQWLRQQGAEWPSRFNWFPWKSEVLAWARAEGCTTPTRSA